MRQILNALFYVAREGCSWRALPHDFPPWKTVYNYFQAWQRDGTWTRLVDALRPKVRQAKGRGQRPRVAYLDSQTVKTMGGGDPPGFDPAKQTKGRKRHIVVDSLGLLLAVLVTAGSVPDAVAARQVLGTVTARRFPELTVVHTDTAYAKYGLPEWVEEHRGYVLHVVRRPEEAEGWELLPQRWVVERTFAWLGWYRRLSKDYEHTTASSKAMVQVAAVHNMLHKLRPAKVKYPFRFKRPEKKVAA